VVMRITDILLAFPGILLAIALVAVLGPSLNNVILFLDQQLAEIDRELDQFTKDHFQDLRKLLNPILKLFFNPNRIVNALHIQSQVNAEYHGRFRQREEMDPLFYEVVHNLVVEVTRLGKRDMRPYRRQMQIIFQDPFSSLNPRMSAGDIVGEPLQVHDIAHGKEKQKLVGEIFDQVGLRRSQMSAFPHEFSGGQRQRISIARALSLNPKLIVADEPVSALDVSIQAQVLNLMMDLQREMGLAYLFISHNLAVVEHISHRIAVMYLGRIVEYTDKRTLFTRPLHPYTESLLLAVPVPDPRVKRQKRLLQGDVPSPINPPSGCHFHTRCPYAVERCRVESPALREVKPGQLVACHLR